MFDNSHKFLMIRPSYQRFAYHLIGLVAIYIVQVRNLIPVPNCHNSNPFQLTKGRFDQIPLEMRGPIYYGKLQWGKISQ